MTDTPRPVTIEQVMAITGLGPVQARRDVRAGLLPGRMRGRQYVCSPGEYQAWLEGRWTPKPTPAPVPMLRKRETA